MMANMWRYCAIVLIALVAVAPRQTHSLYFNGDSWFQATKGEVWPMPNCRTVKEDYKLLHLDRFRFQVGGETCDIVGKAVDRYSKILFLDGSAMGISASRESPTQCIKYDPRYKDHLTSLDIVLTQPCEDRPHLYMNESYELEITGTSSVAVLQAPSVWGILRGLETFSQLLTPSFLYNAMKVKCQTIVDEPKLPHRGLLLDTSRHYIPVSDIKLTLDAMSYNKLNVFHWHITDDQSSPEENTTHPDLPAKGAKGYRNSMVYTNNDVEEIIEYARLRGIRVMPEFDIPWRATSWGTDYPKLPTTCYDLRSSDSTEKPDGKMAPINLKNSALYTFIRNLFTEIVRIFRDEYLHLGGDDVPFYCWTTNMGTLTYMIAHNMTKFPDPDGEYITMLLNISDSLNTKSIVWQEAFDNGVKLPTTTTVHVWKLPAWQEELERATKAGHPVLLSSCWQLDHLAGGGDWIKYYECNPFDFADAANVTHLMLGGEACMWSEFVDEHNMHPRIWPRASAAAERLWSNNKQDNNAAVKRLEEHTCRMNTRGIPIQQSIGLGLCPKLSSISFWDELIRIKQLPDIY